MSEVHGYTNCSEKLNSWRSIKDDPPPYESLIIVCWDNGSVRPCYRKNGLSGDYYTMGGILTFEEPDWWMPFPKAHGVE